MARRGDRALRVRRSVSRTRTACSRERSGRRADADAHLAVVRRDESAHRARTPEPLVAVDVEVGPVAVHERARVRADAVERSLDRPGDERVHAVGPDRQAARVRRSSTPSASTRGDARRPRPSSSRRRSVTRSSMSHRRAGRAGGVDEDSVEHRAAWCVQRVDAGGRLDRQRTGPVLVVEERAADRRRARPRRSRRAGPSV